MPATLDIAVVSAPSVSGSLDVTGNIAITSIPPILPAPPLEVNAVLNVLSISGSLPTQDFNFESPIFENKYFKKLMLVFTGSIPNSGQATISVPIVDPFNSVEFPGWGSGTGSGTQIVPGTKWLPEPLPRFWKLKGILYGVVGSGYNLQITGYYF